MQRLSLLDLRLCLHVPMLFSDVGNAEASSIPDGSMRTLATVKLQTWAKGVIVRNGFQHARGMVLGSGGWKPYDVRKAASHYDRRGFVTFARHLRRWANAAPARPPGYKRRS